MATTQSKLALRDMRGRPCKYLIATTSDLPAATAVARAAHHILVVDRSGSMWGSMDQLRDTILKVLTLSEYKDADLRISLVSYSSQGDVTVHFERAPVAQVMAPGSQMQDSIRKLRPTGLTCISQGLKEAQRIALRVPGELCCVTLHSDGYANDRSPTEEARQIVAVAADMAKIPDLWASCIAYSAYSDFGLLSSVATALSGKCIQATSIKQVWDELEATQAALAGSVAPAVSLPLPAGAWFQVVACPSLGKVVAGGHDLSVRGLPATAAAFTVSYAVVPEDAWNASTATEAVPGAIEALVLSRGLLACGQVTAAKQALVSYQSPGLLERHARALTPAQIGALATDLDECLTGAMSPAVQGGSYGLPGGDKESVLEVLSSLRGGDVEVDVAALAAIYQKRSLKRVAGTRQEDGTIKRPWLRVANRGDAQWAHLSSVDANDSTANVNVLLTRSIALEVVDDGTTIQVVAGRSLDRLTGFNNYTIIGDGQLCVSKLVVRTANLRTQRRLESIGCVMVAEGTAKVYELDLAGRPLVPDVDGTGLDGSFKALAKLKVVSSMLTACMKGRSDEVSPDQLDELKRHFLSPAMFVSLPSTTAHADLQAAIAAGHVDTRLSYKIEVGDATILSLGKFHSANKFLDRFYEGATGGTALAKPTMLDWWDPTVTWKRKVLSAKLKVTPVDEFMAPIFDQFLGIGGMALTNAVADAGDDVLAATLLQAITGKGDAATEVLTDVRKFVDGCYEAVMDNRVRPLVLYVGATGLLPDALSELPAMTADDLSKKFPVLALGKAESEGTFYVTAGGTVLSIYVKGENFTTQSGLAALAALGQAEPEADAA